MATLYDIDAKIRDFPFETDPDTGELLNASALDALEMERNSKLENIACYCKNLAADAAAIKAEEATLKKRREALERSVDRLKAYLSASLNGQKFVTARAAVTFRKTQSVRVDDPDAAIESLRSGGFSDAIRYKAPEIDKTAVKRLLKDGREIQGVSLAESLSMSIK